MLIINDSYDEEKIKQLLSDCIHNYFSSMTDKLNNLTLSTLMKKNPYLLKIKGMKSVSELIQSSLSAYISSSEETVFGNVFFEPLAIGVCGGQKALAEGLDVVIDKGDSIYAIAVKSGPKVFNSDSRKKQEQNFNKASILAKQAKKAFFPIIGYCYGRKKFRQDSQIQELAGQNFWHAITGDEDFYKKLIYWCDEVKTDYLKEYDNAYINALNRLCTEFGQKFCTSDGAIDWAKMAEFSSSAK